MYVSSWMLSHTIIQTTRLKCLDLRHFPTGIVTQPEVWKFWSNNQGISAGILQDENCQFCCLTSQHSLALLVFYFHLKFRGIQVAMRVLSMYAHQIQVELKAHPKGQAITRKPQP